MVRLGRHQVVLAVVGLAAFALTTSGCSRPQASKGCTSDAQCGAGMRCSSGVCVAQAEPAVGCARNEDCAPTQACADGVCVDESLLDGRCDVAPTTLDFGATAYRDPAVAFVEIDNWASSELLVSLGDIHQADGGTGAFRFESPAPGDLPILARVDDRHPGLLFVRLEFSPDHVGEYSATLQIFRPSACARVLTLRGVGVERRCEIEPTGMVDGHRIPFADFGYVNPGSKSIRRITLKCAGNIVISIARISQPANVAGAPFASESVGQTFTTNGGEPFSIEVSFSPTELGGQIGRLFFVTDDQTASTGSIELRGVGGGPKIDVQPAQLNFGEVDVGAYLPRGVVAANVGTDVGGTTDDNLVFAVLDEGAWVEKRAEITGPDATEFSVEWPPQGYPLLGLSARENAEIRVRFAPKTAGHKEAVLHVYSNDPDVPLLDVPLAGDAVELPPCDYEIMPPALDFATVEPLDKLTLSFLIVNRAIEPANTCIIPMVELDRASRESGAFEIMDGPHDGEPAVVIPAGGSLRVSVRFAPTQDGSYSGAIDVFASNPSRPKAQVQLSGIGAPSCLTLVPRELDFGAIGHDCSSRQRSLRVINTCSDAVLFVSVSNQPGTSGEFSVTKVPALPSFIGDEVDLGATYHPIDLGADVGALTLRTGLYSVVVPVSGQGASNPVQTDVFVVEQPKVDALLVVDNSPSMEDKQSRFAGFYADFMSAAIAGNVDFHVAITTSEIGPDTTNGRFLPLTGANPRVITPSTPDKEQAFTANIMVGATGTTESLLYPAYLAVTSPLLNGHNVGFYRDDARLAIVVVTDAADQNVLARPVSFYRYFFESLKGYRRDAFTVSGLIPMAATAPDPSSGCSYDASDSGWDYRLKEIIGVSGGRMEEVCSADWSAPLDRISQRVFGPTSRYLLSNAPDLTAGANPITITVDGVPFPEVSSRGVPQWSYDAAENAIDIAPTALPAPGSTVSVAYAVACL